VPYPKKQTKSQKWPKAKVEQVVLWSIGRDAMASAKIVSHIEDG